MPVINKWVWRKIPDITPNKQGGGYFKKKMTKTNKPRNLIWAIYKSTPPPPQYLASMNTDINRFSKESQSFQVLDGTVISV